MAFNRDSKFSDHRPSEQSWGVLDFNHNIHTYNLTFEEARELAEELSRDFNADYTAVPYDD